MKTTAERIELAENRRFAAIAKMEEAMHRMEVAERAGSAPDPADAEAFEAARSDVLTADVELRELAKYARSALDASPRLDVPSLSGLSGLDLDAPASVRAAMPQRAGRVDVAPLLRALHQSANRTTGGVVLRTLLQGTVAGTMGRTTQEGPLVAVGTYGALPLVQAVQSIPVAASVYHWNRVSPTVQPAVGGKQGTEGALKPNVQLQSTPVTSTLATFAAWEKVSLQALEDQLGLAQAVESLLTGAVLRSADADAWTAYLAGCTAIVPDATDAVATIVRTAAKIAAAGGTGIRAVLSPLDYADMMLVKASTSGQWLGLPPGVEMPPLLQSSGVPAGKLLVTAGSDGAFVAVRSEIVATIGLADDDFTRNLRTVLVEGRMVADVRNAQLAYIGDLIAP